MQEAAGKSPVGSPVAAGLSAFNRRLWKAIDAVEVAVLAAGTAALALLLIANVIARSFFRSLYYAEEISEFLVIFITFAGTSYGVRKARHIRMGAFFDLMGPRLEKIFIFAISAVAALVMFLMFRYSLAYLLAMSRVAQHTPALRLPSWIFVVIVPVGFFMSGVQYVRTMVRNLARREVWLSPEQKSEYEEDIKSEKYGGY